MKLKWLLLAVFICSAQFSFANELLPKKAEHYYGSDLSHRVRGLKSKLFKVLSYYHISKSGDYDEVVEECPEDKQELCYSHKKFGYKTARKYLFGQVHLEGESEDSYKLQSVYCLDVISNQDLPASAQLGPLQIPSHRVLNAEHAWPQSRFNHSLPKTFQKSDLHSLFPVRMNVNSTRGNHPYGNVVEVKNLVCPDAALGINEKGDTVFEPAEQVKGDMARASFYFATRYNLKIAAQQERRLRQWHQQDPVSRAERRRNNIVFAIQQVRNPFVDHPEWVEKIRDF